MKLPFLATLASTVLALLIVGCGGSGGGENTGASAGNGTLAVRLADAPDPSITALNITIDRVQANVNGGWQDVSTTPRTLNLLDLTRNDTELGSTTLPAGRYNQVRLFTSSATVTDATGTHDVTIPGGAQTGIKVNVNYDIGPDTVTTLLLDFNVDKSLIKTGNGRYRLQPVIPAVVKVLSGTITGSVNGPDGTLANAQVSAVYTAGDKYPLGTEVNTSSTATDGTFKIWALLPGTYTLNYSYTDPQTNQVLAATQPGVVVTANQNTTAPTVTVSAPPPAGG
jgi:hypothetical protein